MKLQPGGSEGGEGKFLLGLLFLVAGLWLFFDSVRFTTAHHGWISGALGGGRGGRGGGLMETTSMGLVLVPLFIGVVALFFDARRTWAWVLSAVGIAILVVEIASRFRPRFEVKASHAILLLVLVGGGLGFMLRAYVENRRAESIEGGESIEGAEDPPDGSG